MSVAQVATRSLHLPITVHGAPHARPHAIICSTKKSYHQLILSWCAAWAWSFVVTFTETFLGNDHSRNNPLSLTLEPTEGTRSPDYSGPGYWANRIRILCIPRRPRRMHGLRPQLERWVPTIRNAKKNRSRTRLRKRNPSAPIYPQLKLTMNTYVFVLSSTVLSIAAFSYHEALEILVKAVGIDAAADYLFSELN